MPAAENDVLRLFARARHVSLTDIAANVFTVKVGAVGPGDDPKIIDACKEYVDATLGAAPGTISSEYYGGLMTIENITQDIIMDEVQLTWAGSNSSDALPPTVAALIIARTATKRSQGRKYIVGVDQDGENNGVWTQGAMAFLEAMADVYWQSYTGSLGHTLTPGVAGVINGVFGFRPFISAKVIGTNRTQRSRTIGRGI